MGLVRIGSFRPFPADRIRDALAGIPHVVALDRADSPGGAAPLFAELAAALNGRAAVQSVVYGLGGRDLHPTDVEAVFAALGTVSEPVYLGLRSGA